MINTSNEYKQYLASSRHFVGEAGIVLADATELTVDSTQITEGGIKIEDATTPNGKFTIGQFVANVLTVMLKNEFGEYDGYDFYDAVIRPKVGLVLSATIESFNKGVFTVDDPKKLSNGNIKLVCFDNAMKFDVPFSGVTVTYPITALNLLTAICTYCGVTLKTIDFTNKDFQIASAPESKALTCRDVVSFIAQIAGCFARCDTSGELELRWYDIAAFEQENPLDGGEFDSSNPYATGDAADGGDFTFTESTDYDGGTFAGAERYHHIYSISTQSIGTDDVVITGVKVDAVLDDLEDEETYTYGTTGYVLAISENPLIQLGQAQSVAETVGAKIVGMRFRPLTVNALSDPAIEAGDVAYVTDRKGNSYKTLITNLSYTIGQYETLTCDAESPMRYSTTRFTQATKVIVDARKHIKAEKTARELAIQQLTEALENSSGLYQTITVQPDGSKIYYMHDKPTLAESAIVWKMTAEAFAVSTDGGETYTAGLTADGSAIVERLSAVGINADWINAGEINGINIHGAKYYDDTDTSYMELGPSTEFPDDTLRMYSNYENHDTSHSYLWSFRTWARRTKNVDGVTYDVYCGIAVGGNIVTYTGNSATGFVVRPQGAWSFSQATIPDFVKNYSTAAPLKLGYNTSTKRLNLYTDGGALIGYIPYT